VSQYDPVEVATVYIAMFAARLDDHAFWRPTPDGEAEGHWERARRPLTPEAALGGLRGDKPVSSYMEDAVGATHVGAVDFDTEDGYARGLEVAGVMARAGAYPMLERSRRGCHLWVVIDDQVPGQAMRLALRWWTGQANAHWARDPKVEILPKRLEQRGPDTVGSPLRMPMMPHPVAGRRWPLLRADGTRLGESVSATLLAVDQTPAGLVREAAERAPLPPDECRIPAWARPVAREPGDCVQVLEAAGVARAVPGRGCRCPLHDDRVASLSIARDGERVWCKSPSCVAYNNGRGLGADQLARALGELAAAPA